MLTKRSKRLSEQAGAAEARAPRGRGRAPPRVPSPRAPAADLTASLSSPLLRPQRRRSQRRRSARGAREWDGESAAPRPNTSPREEPCLTLVVHPGWCSGPLLASGRSCADFHSTLERLGRFFTQRGRSRAARRSQISHVERSIVVFCVFWRGGPRSFPIFAILCESLNTSAQLPRWLYAEARLPAESLQKLCRAGERDSTSDNQRRATFPACRRGASDALRATKAQALRMV